jgi:hypothetical protein
LNNEREYVPLQEYPSSAVMFPRHIAVISLEPPTTVAPPQLPAPRAGDLPSSLEIAAAIAKKNRAKVLV